MWDQVNLIFSRATGRIVENIANFLPGLVVLVVLLVLALIAALVVRVVLYRLLKGLDFDQWASRTGLALLSDWSPEKSASLLVARVAQWAILILGFLAGLSALDATMPSYFAMTVFGYLPNVLAAVIILIFGDLLARFLARSVLISAVNMQIHSARLLSVGVKWLVLIMAATMALEQIGLGRDILLLAFGILFGGVVLAMALAVGLGSKDAVSRTLDRQLRESSEQHRSQGIDHV
jgi:Mechanosensitive ion channel, conserved TM helix